MNYHEAKSKLLGHKNLLTPQLLKTNPTHMILGCFIAPIDRNTHREEMIKTQVIENKQPNDMVLQELGVINNNLDVFIYVQLGGNYVIQVLDDYLKSNLNQR